MFCFCAEFSQLETITPAKRTVCDKYDARPNAQIPEHVWRPSLCFSAQQSHDSDSCGSCMTSPQETAESSPSAKEKSLRQVSGRWTKLFTSCFLHELGQHVCSVHPQLLDPSRQWWKVRDSRGEEGFVPNNVLEPHEEPPIQVGHSNPQHVKSDSVSLERQHFANWTKPVELCNQNWRRHWSHGWVKFSCLIWVISLLSSFSFPRGLEAPLCWRKGPGQQKWKPGSKTRALATCKCFNFRSYWTFFFVSVHWDTHPIGRVIKIYFSYSFCFCWGCFNSVERISNHAIHTNSIQISSKLEAHL